TFDPEPQPPELSLNDVGEIRLRTSRPLAYDGYVTNRLTGSFILIEQGTNATVAAGMLLPPTETVKPEYTDFAICLIVAAQRPRQCVVGSPDPASHIIRDVPQIRRVGGRGLQSAST